MANIIEKAFDVSKNIVRTIFLGKPNLFTTSDLNRQIEAFKYQLDLIDDKTGMIIHGGKLSSVEWLNGYLKVALMPIDLGGSAEDISIEFKGCRFFPLTMSNVWEINFNNSAPKAYLCLTAVKEEVSYSDDFTHDIAGAKFKDGTSYPAANQLVYKNESIVFTHSVSSVENFVGVIATFTLSKSGKVAIEENFIHNEKESSLAMRSNTIKNSDTTLRGSIGNGLTYDEAFSIIENRFTNFSPDWHRCESPDSSENIGGTFDPSFCVRKGIMYVSYSSSYATMNVKGLDKRRYVFPLAYFPLEAKKNLIKYFQVSQQYWGFSGGGDIFEDPYYYHIVGHFGDGSCFVNWQDSGDNPFSGFGDVRVCLFVKSTFQGEILDVFLGCYLTSACKFPVPTEAISAIKGFLTYGSPAYWNIFETQHGVVHPNFIGGTFYMPLLSL